MEKLSLLVALDLKPISGLPQDMLTLIVNMHNLTKANEYSVMFMQIIRVLLKLVQTHRHVGSHG